MRTIRVLAAVLGLLAALVLAGCADDGGADAGGAGQVESADEAAAARDGAAEDAGTPADPSGGDDRDRGGEAAGVLLDDRSLIYTGSLTVRVSDVAGAAQQVAALADRYGGFVGGDHRSTVDDHASATLVLRIPSESFLAAVEDVATLGTEQVREVRTEDVTGEVVDLRSRIATARASVARTRELLARAESIADIVAVEEELAEREARLGSLEARQRRLADLTTLSTITATLTSEDEKPADEPAGFLAGLRVGWDAFTGSLRVAVLVLGALLPWLVAVGVPAGVLAWWARRRRAGLTAGDAPPPTATAHPPVEAG